MPDHTDIPRFSTFCFRHVFFIQHALDGHSLAAYEIPADFHSYFIVHNFIQMPQIFTVSPPPNTHILLSLARKHNVQCHALNTPPYSQEESENRIACEH